MNSVTHVFQEQLFLKNIMNTWKIHVVTIYIKSCQPSWTPYFTDIVQGFFLDLSFYDLST